MQLADIFQSTLPLRGATCAGSVSQRSSTISIHTPLAGSDSDACGMVCRQEYFNPHSPCGERPQIISAKLLMMTFQSTLPLRGATTLVSTLPAPFQFQSTLPLRGATDAETESENDDEISIHTPLAGSDRSHGSGYAGGSNFNPHSPCGERRVTVFADAAIVYDFNPHSPCGERPLNEIIDWCEQLISIHTPLAGSDHVFPYANAEDNISIHTPLAGSDRRNETFLTK